MLHPEHPPTHFVTVPITPRRCPLPAGHCPFTHVSFYPTRSRRCSSTPLARHDHSTCRSLNMCGTLWDDVCCGLQYQQQTTTSCNNKWSWRGTLLPQDDIRRLHDCRTASSLKAVTQDTHTVVQDTLIEVEVFTFLFTIYVHFRAEERCLGVPGVMHTAKEGTSSWLQGFETLCFGALNRVSAEREPFTGLNSSPTRAWSLMAVLPNGENEILALARMTELQPPQPAAAVSSQCPTRSSEFRASKHVCVAATNDPPSQQPNSLSKRDPIADTSSYSVEERLVGSVWTHERPHTGKSIEDVRGGFTRRFHKAVPPKRKILYWEHKLSLTGSVKDKQKPGRPTSQQDTCAAVEASLLRSPKKSLMVFRQSTCIHVVYSSAACGNRAGRCRWSVGFLGDFPFAPPFHSGAAPYSLLSPSPALKTSLLRATQITSLTIPPPEVKLTFLLSSSRYSCVGQVKPFFISALSPLFSATADFPILVDPSLGQSRRSLIPDRASGRKTTGPVARANPSGAAAVQWLERTQVGPQRFSG
ncbi:hypothetical protein PR048_023356 [Dryococelus australis]|uniref:Uncharacterized protein n=1 Tax=Dryococelus australis TaxID=614101 RepID=A0ABQ9GTU9_9NEOP|nr:hypothetical protein PR048_023356 [Dryococelus australis]